MPTSWFDLKRSPLTGPLACFRPEFLGVLCSELDTTQHRHYAIQVTLAFDQPFSLELAGEDAFETKAVIIPADRPHRFSSFSGNHLFLLIDPLSELGQKLTRLGEMKKNMRSLTDSIFDRAHPDVRRILSSPKAVQIFDDLYTYLTDMTIEAPDRVLDDRIRSVIQMCRGNKGKKLVLQDLMESIYLSEGRLRHLFKQETGVSFRRYQKWLRTIDAIGLSRTSRANLTELAHETGFSDSAHLSRTFKEMFGVPPSLIFKDMRL